MKLRPVMLGMLICLLMFPISSRAQDQTQKNENPISHLRVDILLTEYNGDKKVSSLPYTLYVASRPRGGEMPANLRMGVRVPVPENTRYLDVGTDIDCRASTLDNGSYELSIGVNRSSIYTASKEQAGSEQIRPLPDTPVTRNFNSRFDISLRDGETREGTSATDPLNGNILKITVTLHVLK
ncbi:MAG TPA: hypothetical protein VGR93_07535 [Candidatus Acidoferrales bacterium]|nr:hypothetical protein [Candidatus Acidoferrales bacterium]